MSQETCRPNRGPKRAGRLAAASRLDAGAFARARGHARLSSDVTIRVCTTCRAEGEAEGPRAGARLYDALCQSRREGDPRIAGVECFSVCKRPCTISFSAPGAWTYVYGDFAAETDPQEIIAAARQFGAAPQGLIPWKERPTSLKKGVVARLPPMEPA